MSAVSQATQMRGVPTPARGLAIALVLAALTFGAAYAVGSGAKRSATSPAPGQLAPVSTLAGQASVRVTVPGAAGTIPALAALARPAHHASPPSQRPSSVGQTPPTPAPAATTQNTVSPPVQTASTAQPPVVQRPVVVQPVHTTPTPPVVVVHH